MLMELHYTAFSSVLQKNPISQLQQLADLSALSKPLIEGHDGTMSCFSDAILEFWNTLEPPPSVPTGVEVLWPFDDPEVRRVREQFFSEFFSDDRPRIFLIGINPGRFGAGVTGLNFTDTRCLREICGIEHELPESKELSADFVYRMIDHYGGPRAFYSRFYVTALSPVGYIKDGKNINYYDVKGFTEDLDSWMALVMEKQAVAGCDRRVAFSMGQGTNAEALRHFNERHGFFDEIRSLPHPRWVMQYKRKKLSEYLDLYRRELLSVLN